MDKHFKALHNNLINLGKKSRAEHAYDLKKMDEATDARKQNVFVVLKDLVKQKRQADPTFKLTTRALDDLVKANPESFPGITAGISVLRYWKGEMVYLREKVDAAIKEEDIL